MNRIPTVHSLKIGTKEYFVHGSNTDTLKEIANVIGLEFDSITPSHLSDSQSLIKVWVIGELYDYLNEE